MCLNPLSSSHSQVNTSKMALTLFYLFLLNSIQEKNTIREQVATKKKNLYKKEWLLAKLAVMMRCVVMDII